MPIDSLLHLTDFHFWQVVLNPLQLMNKRLIGNANVFLRRRHEFLMERADAYSDQAVATGVRHALLSGDFTSTSTEREFASSAAFARRLEKAGLTLHAFPGNHDVYTFEAARRRRFERHFDRWFPDEGLPAHRTLEGGTSLIMVPTVCPNILSSKGRISDVEIEGLEERLRTASSPAIVAGHYPVLMKTRGYVTKPSRQLRNAEALRKAMGNSGKRILYVSGHVHRFSYTQDDQFENLEHLTTGAFFRTAPETDSTGEFSEIRVHEDRFEVMLHRHAGEWTAKDQQKAAP